MTSGESNNASRSKVPDAFCENEAGRVFLQSPKGFRFSGYKLLMTYVLYNLLSNSFRPIEKIKGAYIEIRLAPNADVNQIIIRDTGFGIPAKCLPLIFNELYNGAPETMVLVLSYCRRVMEILSVNQS